MNSGLGLECTLGLNVLDILVLYVALPCCCLCVYVCLLIPLLYFNDLEPKLLEPCASLLSGGVALSLNENKNLIPGSRRLFLKLCYQK